MVGFLIYEEIKIIMRGRRGQNMKKIRGRREEEKVDYNTKQNNDRRCRRQTVKKEKGEEKRRIDGLLYEIAQ